jgi:hypothetical protein
VVQPVALFLRERDSDLVRSPPVCDVGDEFPASWDVPVIDSRERVALCCVDVLPFAHAMIVSWWASASFCCEKDSMNWLPLNSS